MKFIRYVCVAAGCLLLFSQLKVTSQERVTEAKNLGPGTHTRVIQVDELLRRYLVFVPSTYTPEKPLPVVVAYHGGGGNPQSMIRLSGLNAKAEDSGFIVVYPYGSGLSKDRGLTFNAGNVGGYAMRRQIDDVGFTSALLDDLKSCVQMDESRVYATGISNGGMMAYRVADELSERFAAIAPVGGPMGLETCQPEFPVAVMHFHGTNDELAPYAGGKGKGSPTVPAFLRPVFFSVEHSLAKWVKANSCNAEPTEEEFLDIADDGMTCSKTVWTNGKEGTEVVLIKIEGGGHTWPGQVPPTTFLGPSTKDISANDLMWEFFQRHQRKLSDN